MLSNQANVTKATLIASHENIYNTESFQQRVTKCCLPNEVLQSIYWADVIGLIPEGDMHFSKHFLQFLQKGTLQICPSSRTDPVFIVHTILPR